MPNLGGCLCGAVRYTIEGPVMFTALCHCTHCQKQSGSAFSIIVGVQETSLTIKGEVKAYNDKCDEGRAVRREFCPACGSPLFTVGDGAPGMVFVKAGTLDDSSGLNPGMQLWTVSAQPWVKLDHAMKSFLRQPGF